MPGFVVAQLVGLLVGVGLLLALYPDAGRAADDVVVAAPGRRAVHREPSHRRIQTMSDKPSVLFVCVHNAGRSQMAAGWLRHLAGDAVEVRSAGSAPADTDQPGRRRRPWARSASTSPTRHPKMLDYETAEASDVIITMGCGDACPVFPGKRYEDWKLDDPAGQGVDAVRPIRDEIKTRIEKLLADLIPAA